LMFKNEKINVQMKLVIPGKVESKF
jgi:hypothetical protein